MSSSSFEQRREAFRVGLSDGRSRVARASGETAEFELRDLSVSGARVIGGLHLDLGETVTIAIGLHDDEVVTADARVVRLDPHGCGVRFETLPTPVENRISRYLADQQRHRVRPRD